MALLPDATEDDTILTFHNATRDAVNTGEIPDRTISQMEAETDSNAHIAIITDRVSGQKILELWIGNSFMRRL